MPDDALDFAGIRPFLRRRLTSLFGHRVADGPCPFVSSLYRHPTVAELRGALDFLGRHFRFVTLDEVAGHFAHGRPLPDYPLFLSFDDGFRNMIDCVAPILREAGVPATFFITADAVDNRRLFYGLRRSYLIGRLEKDAERRALCEALREASVHAPEGRSLVDRAARTLEVDWQAVLAAERPFMTRAACRSLLDMGFSLGAHGASHERFAELDEPSRTREVTASIDFMQDAFGLDRVAFAFPHSHRGVDRGWMNDRIADDARLSIFFGTGGFAPNDRALVHRVGLDRPVQDIGPFDVAETISAAYRRARAKDAPSIPAR